MEKTTYYLYKQDAVIEEILGKLINEGFAEIIDFSKKVDDETISRKTLSTIKSSAMYAAYKQAKRDTVTAMTLAAKYLKGFNLTKEEIKTLNELIDNEQVVIEDDPTK